MIASIAPWPTMTGTTPMPTWSTPLPAAARWSRKKHCGTVTWSPSGRYLLTFDGKDWSTISVPDAKTVNLTAALPVKFWNEDTDTSTPLAYGSAGWTKDGNSVLLYDRFDIWRVSPDGSGARNITAGYGRKQSLRFRYVRLETDPRERWIDPAKPLLLFAENLKTWESGFFRGAIEGGEPKQLAMAPKYFTLPVKAKDADVLLLTEQPFGEFPDLIATDGNFKELRKVSNANPQQAQILWGTSEVVEFKNADGVPLTAALSSCVPSCVSGRYSRRTKSSPSAWRPWRKSTTGASRWCSIL